MGQGMLPILKVSRGLIILLQDLNRQRVSLCPCRVERGDVAQVIQSTGMQKSSIDYSISIKSTPDVMRAYLFDLLVRNTKTKLNNQNAIEVETGNKRPLPERRPVSAGEKPRPYRPYLRLSPLVPPTTAGVRGEWCLPRTVPALGPLPAVSSRPSPFASPTPTRKKKQEKASMQACVVSVRPTVLVFC